MEKHIIFSDIDGTLYGLDGAIHPQTIKDIKLAQDLGVEFVICTGNPFFTEGKMIDVARKLNVRYVVSSNGACIYDMEEKRFIHTSLVPKEDADKILDLAKEIKASAFWWDEENIYISSTGSEEVRKKVSKAILKGSGLIDKSDQITKDIFKIEFYDEPSKVDKANAFAKELGFQAARMKPEHVEITHVGVSKGHGVKQLCKLLNVNIANTMGIGDSANDLEMFKVVGHSYVMDNAKDEVKEVAMHYTSDVSQNGLGEAIIDYLHRTKLDR